MASNSIPKIKIYRLDSNYDQSNDNDLQSMSDDEMIPVVQKNPNPFNTEEMVGVVQRQDSRLVCESAKSYGMVIPVTFNASKYFESTEAVMCEGWVLGKGNMHVYVRVKTGDGDTGDEEESRNDKITIGDIDYNIVNLKDSETSGNNVNNRWVELDRRFWDYTVESKKTYYINDEYLLSKPEDDFEVHEMDYISFKLGKILLNSKRVFKNTYTGSGSNYTEIDSIIVVYKKYCELGGYFTANNKTGNGFDSGAENGYCSKIVNDNTDGSIKKPTSRYRVPFGGIYNGNMKGRCLHVGTGDNMKRVCMTEGNDEVNNDEMNYYEGNYLYRRRIYPFRVKVLVDDTDDNDDALSYFVRDYNGSTYCVIDNGKSSVPCELSWYLDDIMKPIAFEMIKIDRGTSDERLIFKKLTKNQVSIQYQSSKGNYYVVTLTPKYYETGKNNGHMYPKVLFLAYNYVDDSLGNIFDFDYNYHSDGFYEKSKNIGYGYANDGRILSDGNSIKENGLSVYLRRDMLFSPSDSTIHDSTRDGTLVNNGSTITFSIPDESDFNDVDNNEKRRITDGLACIDVTQGMKLYYDGKLIWSQGEETCTIESKEYSISFRNNRTFTITNTNDNNSFGNYNEFMLSYYEKRPMSFKQASGVNPYCIGYRIPCYEKVKTSTLFVSSFPNWIKGHVNNDLDVFYGNELYSGTELSNGEQKDYHNIYPSYVKDGWYAMYSEGAIEFNEEKTEQNYFDMLNYVNFDDFEDWDTASKWNGYSSDSGYPGMMPNYWKDVGNYQLSYYKVRYNVAHADGIYSVVRARMSNFSNKNGESKYALLEDDDFKDSYGKRWLVKSDDELRRMHECGHDELPIIEHSDGKETPSVLEDIEVSNGNVIIPGTSDDRISMFLIKGNCHAVFFVNSSTHDTEKLTSIDGLDGSYTRIHVKTTSSADDIPNCFAIGLEKDQEEIDFSGDPEDLKKTIVELDDNKINWVYLPDNDDVFKGYYNADKDTYKGVDISLVQTSEITIDGGTMTYWMNDDDSKWKDVEDNIVNPVMDGNDYTGILRRYRYHRSNDSSWSYDVYFEVVSYRYSVNEGETYDGAGTMPLKGVEVAAYRIRTK